MVPQEQGKSNSFEPKVRYHSGSERVEIEHESLFSILDSITNARNSQTTQGSYDDEFSECMVKDSDIETKTSAINTEDCSSDKKRQVKSVEDCKKTIGRDSAAVRIVDEHIDEYGIFHDYPVDSDKSDVFDKHEVDVKEINSLKEESNVDETEPRVETQLQKQTRMSEVVVNHVDVRTGVGCTRDSEDFISTVIERNAQGDQRTKHQDGDDELHNDDMEDYPEESCLETRQVDDDLISEENEAKLMTFKESIQIDDEIDEIDDGNGTFKSTNETENTEVNTTGIKDKDQDGEGEHIDEISNEMQDEIDIKMTDDNCADTTGNEQGHGQVDFEGEDIEECDEEASINAADKNTDDINNDYGSENIQVEIHDEDSRNTQDRRENLDNENVTEEANNETHDEDFRNTQEDFHNDDNENNDENITDASHVVTHGDSTQDDFDHRVNPDNENSDDNITKEENDENNDEDFRNTQEDVDNENNDEHITEEENDETDDEDFINAENDFHYNDIPDNENNDENITEEESDDKNDEDFRNPDNPDNENSDDNITEDENDEDKSNSQEDFDHRDHPDNENNDDNITDASHFVTPENNTQEDFDRHDNPDNENNDENITKEESDDNNDEYFRNTHEDFHHHDNPDNENNDENITEDENDEDKSNSQEDFDHRDHPDNENNDDNITDASHFVTREGCNTDVTRNLERNEDRDSCKIS